MKDTKIGLICVGLDGEQLLLAEKFHKTALERLTSLGACIVNREAKYTLTRDDVIKQLKECESRGAASVVFLIGTWLLAYHIIDAAVETKLPIGIWGVPEAVSFSSVGLNVVHGAMVEMGIEHEMFYGLPDDESVLTDIKAFADAAQVAAKCRKARFGLIGGRAISAYPTTADPNQIKAVFGIEVEHIDQVLLLELVKQTNEEEMSEFINKVRRKYGKVTADERYLCKSATLYYAIKKIIKEYSLDFCSVKCLGEVIDLYSSCCLPLAVLNNEGYIISCQGNINAGISSFILSELSESPVFFGDINMVDIEEKDVRLINCGSIPTKLAENDADVEIINQYEYMGKGRGACTFFCMKRGKVTFGTLGRRAGEYVMNIAGGEAYKEPIDELARVRTWAQGFVKLDCDAKAFFDNLLCNHSVMGYGDYEKELKYFCSIKGVRVETSN